MRATARSALGSIALLGANPGFAARLLEKQFHLLDTVWWPTAMNNSVTIRANGAQVIDRVNLVLLADLRTLPQVVNQVVNMDKALANFAVAFCKTETADMATCAVMSDTLLACFWIPFESVNRY